MLTRVTEYVPEIVVFNGKIISTVTPTSPTAPFTSTPQLSEPLTSTASSSLPPSTTRNDARGRRSLCQTSAHRKSSVWADFALWKKYKEGEPSWESPWEPGRPG